MTEFLYPLIMFGLTAAAYGLAVSMLPKQEAWPSMLLWFFIAAINASLALVWAVRFVLAMLLRFVEGT